jgi:hypothetical protein
MAKQPERWLGMGRRGWIVLQWSVGIFNAVTMLLNLSQGHYVGAAISALCVAVTLDWSLPDDPPSRRSWMRNIVFFFLWTRQEGKVDELLRKQASIIVRMGELLERTAVEAVGPELGSHTNPDYDWTELPNSVRTLRTNAAALSDAASPLCLWWGMIEAQKRIPDDEVVLHFTASGASTSVTAGDLRRLMGAAFVINPATGRPLPAVPKAPQGPMP